MIIQIAGTNSSGKTYAVRQVLAKAEKIVDMRESVLSRKRAIGHRIKLPGVSSVYIGGPYDDMQTSGMDALKGGERGWGVGSFNYDWIVSLHNDGADCILFEGIRMMNHTLGIEMYKKLAPNLTVLFLDVPLPDIFKSLEERRVANGLPAKGYSTKDVEGTIVRSRNYAAKLAALGCRRIRVTREIVVPTIMELLHG